MMSNNKLNILITGGAGFIGTALCNKLSDNGNDVSCFDNFSRKSHINSGLNKNIRIFNGDIRIRETLDQAYIHKYDIIYHLAFINGTKSFYEAPKLVLEVGTKGIVNILDFAYKNNTDKFVLISTSEVYNIPTEIPTTEEERLIIPDPHNPRFSYAGGKIISELMTIHSGLNASIIRPHNVFAENAGQEHIIPEIIKKIVNPINPQYIDNKLLVNIQGSGNETRAFCYISDFIDGLIIAANLSDKTTPIFNVGTEDEIKISDLIYMIANILNIEIQIIPGKKLEGSTNRRCPDITKLSKFGYTPKVSLREGLEKTIDWYKDFYLKGNHE